MLYLNLDRVVVLIDLCNLWMALHGCEINRRVTHA